MESFPAALPACRALEALYRLEVANTVTDRLKSAGQLGASL